MKYTALITTFLLSSTAFAMDSLELSEENSSHARHSLTIVGNVDLKKSIEIEEELQKTREPFPNLQVAALIAEDQPISYSSEDELSFDRLPLRNFIKFRNEKFIKNGDGFYFPNPRANFFAAGDQLVEYVDFYPYDNEMRAMLARLYFHTYKTSQNLNFCLEGLNVMSTVITRELYDREHSERKDLSSLSAYFGEYMTQLSGLVLEYKPLSPFTTNINSFLGADKQNEEIQRNIPSKRQKKRPPNRKPEPCSEQSFIKSCNELISCIYRVNNGPNSSYPHFDALFLSLKKTLENNRGEDGKRLVALLSQSLYDSLKPNCPSSLLLAYAEKCLWPKKLHQAAFRLCKDLFFMKDNETDIIPPSEYGMKADGYNFFGNILICNGKYREASQAFGYAVNLKKDIILEWNLATSKLACKEADDNSLKTMEKVFHLSSEERKNFTCFLPQKIIKLTYQCALQQAGKEDVLTEMLLAQQKKAIEKSLSQCHRKAELIKQAQQVQLLRAPATKSSVTHEKKKAGALEPSMVYEGPFYDDSSNGKEKYVAPEVRVKPKKRGVANPQSPPGEMPPAAPRPVLYIEKLTDNKSAQVVFYTVFSKYRNDVRSDKNVKISIHEINLLFTALKQDFDPAGGKGSHKKGTLNLKEFGSEIEEQMVTFTKVTYLKPYQIKNLRQAFIKAKILPNDEDIQAKVRENFPDIFPM